MSDKEEIQELCNTYSYAATTRDFDTMVGTYAEDGVWEVPGIGLKLAGHAAIRAGSDGVNETVEYFVQLNSPAIIAVNGDTATAKTIIRECGKYKDKQLALEVLGTYEDVVKRTPQGWRFARRLFTVIGMHDFAIAPPSLHEAS